MAQRVALVTGGNQGIGLEIVRQLCQKFEGTVLLAARSAERGHEAVKKLEGEGLSPRLVILDVSSEESVRAAKQVVEEQYKRVDVLVNNAGVLLKAKDMSFQEAARQTIAVNYHGVLRVTTAFLPLMQPNGRIIHISSSGGQIRKLSRHWQQAVMNPDLTVEGLTEIMDQFVSDAQDADFSSKGWPTHSGETYFSPYSVSKIGVNRLAEMQAKTFNSDPSRPGILVNSVCPGWVRTMMGGPSAARSPEQGADTAVFLALLPPGTEQPNGEFIRDRKPANWKSS